MALTTMRVDAEASYRAPLQERGMAVLQSREAVIAMAEVDML